jgi:hypothetical protein
LENWRNFNGGSSFSAQLTDSPMRDYNMIDQPFQTDELFNVLLSPVLMIYRHGTRSSVIVIGCSLAACSKTVLSSAASFCSAIIQIIEG